MHAQIALQIAKSYPDQFAPITPEGLALLIVASLVGLFFMWDTYMSLR